MPHECTTCGQQFDDGSKEMLSGCPNCGGNKFQFQPPGRSSTTEEPAGAAGADDSAATTDHAPSTAEPTESTATSESADPLSDPGTQGELDLPDDTAHVAETAGDESRGDADTAGVDAAEPDAADTTPTESSGERYRDAQIDEYRDAEIADDTGAENSAQRDARSAAASPDEIEDARRRAADTETEGSPDDGSRGRGTPQGPPTETSSGADPAEFDLSDSVGDDDDPVEKQPVAGSAPEREEPVPDENRDLTALREELNQQFESIKITAPGQYELNLMELYDRKEYIISLQEDGRYVIEMADDYGIDED